ncbi:leucine-tRNA ligase [Ephemerocybe angulata]|uniref:leucine--tRNA ligase n=1 Tax=Ephemerocybe angulata TaxID=980116 RepID=A0A8H6HNS2_9AGAR|nr:leucine-tRNA ligase [Tulosesus angulatus]
MAQTIELAQTAKRDYLKALEIKYQDRWQSERLFQANAPSQEELAGLSKEEIKQKFPKWFGNFPFPYMNGSLHLGHAFTISKIEFAAGYQRMLGKRVLFPHGFHVTGMPIKASADKIIRELELFGQDFENFEEVQAKIEAEAEKEAEKEAAVSADKSKAKKGKLNAKSTGLTYQFQIMESIGVPRSEIKKFADPQHWLSYFPPIAINDNNAFGSRIDWRRTFLTTPANPYYDAFVRWQVNKLYRLGKIKFGERYTIYSPKDGQPCMDHDRQDGEGVGPQEYTGVKMEVVQWSPEAEALISNKVGNRKVYLVAATLRPETMYGQTNCFVGTGIKYGVFAANDQEAYVVTLRAARNMAFQGIITPRGNIEKLAELPGTAIIGSKIKAPFAINPEVYVLPMDNVLPTKGTGVVTSTPTYGDMTAPALIKQLKIQSQKDTKQLAEAKEIAYKEGFYNGKMIIGEFKGETVQDAKLKVRDAMIKAGHGTSRSADECVVALMDQWKQTEGLLSKMNTYTPETRHAFQKTLDWLNQWACARTYGLGSKLPWDPHFLVESLSDSTVYMSYYTVAQLLHEDSIDGTKPGPLGITPEQMTDEEKADALKHEYEYFYPFDIRSSAKDLVPNHLTFALYNHAALFPEGQFGADATRLSLADAGDGLEDANFEEKTANANILRVHTLLGWCDDDGMGCADSIANLRTGAKNYHDSVFENEVNDLINITKSHYEATNYKDALKFGFYELQSARDWYREVTADVGMHKDLVLYWIRIAALLITPLAPHFAENIWTDILKEPKSIQLALWPTPSTAVDPTVIEAGAYMRGTIKTIRDAETSLLKMLQKAAKGKKVVETAFDPKKPKSVRVYVASSFPDWQNTAVDVVKSAYDEKEDKVDDAKVRAALMETGLIKDKRVMPFIQAFKKRMGQYGAQTAFRRTLPFSESQVLQELLPYLKKSLNLVDAEVLSVEEAKQHEGEPGFTKSIIEASEPGSPAFEYRNV